MSIALPRTLPISSAARNERDVHLTGVNWGRDLPEGEVVDLRNVVRGRPEPDGQRAARASRAASRSVTSSSSAASTAPR